MQGKNGLSSDSVKACWRHFGRAAAPTIICVLIGFILWIAMGSSTFVVSSPHFALSNASSFISMLLGFLLTFVGITLGFSSSRGIQIIFEHPAPKFQYWVNILTPMLIGAFDLVWATFIGGYLPEGPITIENISMILFCMLILDFVLSFLNTMWLFIKVIAIAMTKEQK